MVHHLFIIGGMSIQNQNFQISRKNLQRPNYVKFYAKHDSGNSIVVKDQL